MNERISAHKLWLVAFGLFGLAALTGAGFRWSILLGALEGISLVNLRHAHSHLMYMGWATPAAAILISRLLVGREEGLAGSWQSPVVMMLLAAAAAYPIFLAFGYQSVSILGVELPLAALIGGFSIASWYWWLFRLRRVYKFSTDRMSLQLWSLAGFFLLLSSLGAWARGMLPRLGLTGPLWEAIALHWFLDMFADGWLMLALLGLIYEMFGEDKGPDWANFLLSAGLPLSFLLGIQASQLPLIELRWLARLAGALVALGTVGHVFHLWRRATGAWFLVLVALTIKAGLQLADSLIGSTSLLAAAGVRILYLHLLLLGGFSLGAIITASSLWNKAAGASVRLLGVAIWLLFAGLLPLTEFWPMGAEGRWPLILAAITATLPALVVLFDLLKNLHERAAYPTSR